MIVTWASFNIEKIEFCCYSMSSEYNHHMVEKAYFVVLTRSSIHNGQTFIVNKDNHSGISIKFCPFCGAEIIHKEL